RRAQPGRELGRELHVGKAAQAIGGEEAALPGARPDDRVAHHRARLYVLVRPDADVGVDGGPGPDRDLAPDHRPLFEQAAVLHGHRAADDAAPQTAVLPHVAVVPDDRIGDLGVVVDRRVVAHDARAVEPDPVAQLGAGADAGGAVDAG